jgi:hypothetical protein
MNPHLEEWKQIKKWYESEHEQTPQIKYRIERIESLIEQEEKKIEFEHFR